MEWLLRAAHRVEEVHALDVVHGPVVAWYEVLRRLCSLRLLEEGRSTDVGLSTRAKQAAL